MALTVRLTSQDSVLAVISPSLPNPFLHLRLSIESLCPWNRALITYHRTFFDLTSSSAKIATHQALERQILKTQLEVKVWTIDSEDLDENLALLIRVENIVRGMITQKCADFAFVGVKSESEFQDKKRQLDHHKEIALELYFKTEGIRLKKDLDHAFYNAIRGQTTFLELQALENYWNWISKQPWGYLQHRKTEIEICKRISKAITEALMEIDPREHPRLKATYGHRLKTNLENTLMWVAFKMGHLQTWNKDPQPGYIMYKVTLIKDSICRMVLWDKLSPLIPSCEEQIQKLSREKKGRRDPFRSALREWIHKRKEFDPEELRQTLAESMFTSSDRTIIQALSLTMGHDLKRTLVEQEILDTDLSENLTIRQDPSLFLRYQLQMRDEMALRLLSPQK